VVCPRIKKARWFIFVRDSGEGEEGVRWCGAACCHNSEIRQGESSGHVAIEVRGERGRTCMGIQVSMPRIRELCLHPAAQLPPERDHLQDNQVLKKDYRQKMLQRVLSATAKNLDASTMHIAEDRHVRWTTHSKIESWFKNWEYDLVDLGFATRDADGKVAIIPKQLRNILNFDETCPSLDGMDGRRGGRPEITLHDPRLPYKGKRSNKDSLTVTLICGSNAAGEALPPHFQFQTKATTDEGQRLRNEVFRYSSQTFGFFGKKVEEGYDSTFGLNTKGGMDDCEFEKYVIQLIKRLYPNTLNRPGMWLILKCDSGPGRLQLELLAKLRFIGVYLYPCVPNTTATDRTYGKFKSQYKHNLELLVDEQVNQDMSVSVPQYKHGLLVFGSIDEDTGGLKLESILDSLRRIALPHGKRSARPPSPANA